MSKDQNSEIALMSIALAVKLPGGNGLATPSFEAPMNFFNVFRWENVESGVEALIVDGKQVDQTRFKGDLLRLFQRRRLMRRVLLNPAPLEVESNALANNGFEVKLQVSVTFMVQDPVKIASKAAPLDELRNTIEGLAAELIRTEAFDFLMRDQGYLRQALKSKLQSAPSVEGVYLIVDVAKALLTGDDRLIETQRLEAMERGRTGLIGVEGNNRLAEAQSQLLIAQQQAELANRQSQWEHEREMEKLRAELQMQNNTAMLEALTEVMKSGGDPRILVQMLNPQTQQPSLSSNTPAGSLLSARTPNPAVERERIVLESIKTQTGIRTYDLMVRDGKLTGALIQFDAYNVVCQCADDHPLTAPTVTVNFADGTAFQPQIIWIPSLNPTLAQALLAILPQIAGRTQTPPPATTQHSFDFEDEDA